MAGTVAAIYLIRDLSHGIASIVAPMRSLGQGDLSAMVPHQGENTEIGQMADTLQGFKDAGSRASRVPRNDAEKKVLPPLRGEQLAQPLPFPHVLPPLPLPIAGGTDFACLKKVASLIAAALRGRNHQWLADMGLLRGDIENRVRFRAPRLDEGALNLCQDATDEGTSEVRMSPEQKSLVQTTWTMVVPIADTAAGLFYDRLFAIDASTPAMFSNTNMAEQKKKLMQALAFVIGGLEKTEQLVPTIQSLGRNHVRYGVTDKHYDSVGSALLWTLEQGLKDAWTPAVKDAWVAAYTLVAGVMKDAAKAEVKASA